MKDGESEEEEQANGGERKRKEKREGQRIMRRLQHIQLTGAAIYSRKTKPLWECAALVPTNIREASGAKLPTQTLPALSLTAESQLWCEVHSDGTRRWTT